MAVTPARVSGLHVARLVIVVAMAVVVALAAGAVFDRWVWWLLAAPIVVGVAGSVTIARRWPLRALGALTSTVAVTIGTAFAAGGTTGDAVVPFGAGAQRLLSTEWPSPDRPDLIATVALFLAFATAVAVELARRDRFHLVPLLPVAMATVVIIALSAPRGSDLLWLLPLALLGFALAALRPGTGTGLREQLLFLRGERRLVPLSMIAIGVAAFVGVPLALTGRADPRRDAPPETAAPVLDPIEATLALRAIDPPVLLHEVRITTIASDAVGRPLTHWRTAALSRYDGRRWDPDLALRPIGRRLAPPASDTIDATVTFLDDDLQLVPFPGSPVVVDASIETDTARTLVRLIDRPTPESSVGIVARVTPNLVDATGAIGTLDIDESTVALTQLATGLAEAGGADESSDLRQRLVGIESAMRDDFVLRSDAPGGGLQRALIERFLRDTRRGNAEQFATGFALLARSLGVDARVATGFVVDPAAATTDGGVVTIGLHSSDAAVWPEVRIGAEWVAFDPVPDEEASDATPPLPEPQVQSPAAPQPPIAPPPDVTEEPNVSDVVDDGTGTSRLPRVVTYALWTLAGTSMLLLPIALVVGGVLGVKWRDRRRRLSGPPEARIVGAWAIATNRLVDGGMSISTADTNEEIADEAGPFVPTAHREVRRLATLASATTFGVPARPDLLAEDAATCLGQVETSMAESRSFVQRIRWRLSLRSLRRRTASPV